MRRRKFITLLGGAAAWPLVAFAQQTQRIRRIGVLMPFAADDPEIVVRVSAFTQALRDLGWTVGSNLQIDYRWSGGDTDRMRSFAAELIAMSPDVIVANGSPAMEALQQASSTVPTVFLAVVDPVGAGYVASLARPGGNVTGFTLFEYSISGKWLELLKQVAPRISQAAILRDAALASGIGQFATLQSAAQSFGVELRPVDVRDASEIKRGITAFANKSNCGLVVTTSTLAVSHRDLIIALAAQYQLPAVYPLRLFVVEEGLISYGPDIIDPYRQLAGYIDRILKGEKPADLPVQAPTKYELVINVKTAKTLDLTIPDKLLATADEVIG